MTRNRHGVEFRDVEINGQLTKREEESLRIAFLGSVWKFGQIGSHD